MIFTSTHHFFFSFIVFRVEKREFLKQEMEAVRAERKACQEQLSQHAGTSRALQVCWKSTGRAIRCFFFCGREGRKSRLFREKVSKFYTVSAFNRQKAEST